MNVRKLAAILAIPALMLAGFTGAALAKGAVTSPQATGPVVQQATPLALASSTAAQAPSANQLESLYENIYAEVNPSVVTVQVVQKPTTNSSFQGFSANPFGSQQAQQPVQQDLGTGFAWDMNGDFVTNNHVIANAGTIQVTFPDGTTVPATVVGADPNSDLAVIHVSVPSSELHPVSLADSSQLKVGEMVIAIGNPYGLSGTMTNGIISALGRSLPVASTSNSSGAHYSIPDIIQTDAAINPGNSGGVLLNTSAQVIGITSAIQSPVDANSGIGFAIPSNILNTVVTSLIKTGHYSHPYLGISGTSMVYDLAKAMNLSDQQKGVLVVSVARGGPAAKAGLQGSNNQVSINGQQAPVGGDIITAIGGQAVSSFEDLSSILFNDKVGQTISVTYLRNGQQHTTQLTLGSLPVQSGQ